ncbi:terpene synthase family protein [Micromonospora thermarum]|uniref:Terpene synthase n=1 Tax=Micromonospora thermarum TaxID=2720024 RepID=A0ABX0Z5N2_9ACTN|nr:terpene synthase family protein [Micromonospora thermarum]NJP32467.1 terpene synthase [Micromonospora thermarum]
MPPSLLNDGFAAASDQGRICSVAARGQRDLQQQVKVYPSLFPNPPVDDAMLSALALSTAFIAPWCGAGQLRIANRASLWVTAEDWQIDNVATALDDVTATVSACVAVAGGATPAAGDELAQFLADIRDELAASAAFAAVQPLWIDEVRRMLTADAREWRWRAARADDETQVPTFAEYLANADNYGASFVNASHWIATGDEQTLNHLPELLAVSRAVQQVLRLVNDLASYERDVKTGDLNCLMLGVDRVEVERQAADRIGQCRALLQSLHGSCPQQALYLAREIGFTTGFYHGTDFWGSHER